MIYNTFKDTKISALGLGSMRLPVMDNDASKIDEAKAAELIDYAISNEVNYFDTGWGYHYGKAASFLGNTLSSYSRDKYLIADKFPGYNKENMAIADEIFQKQLDDCKTDYFDFYLMHDVDDEVVDIYTDRKLSAVDYFIEQKKEGRIRHLGFSSYGNLETIKKFIDEYGEEIEFCQIPLNYMQWALHNVKDKVEYLKNQDIPIWVMDPLYKGRLSELTEERIDVLKIMRPDDSAIGWEYNFAQSVTTVKTVISDISDMESLKETIEIFGEKKRPLNSKEGVVLLGIARDIISENDSKQ